MIIRSYLLELLTNYNNIVLLYVFRIQVFYEVRVEKHERHVYLHKSFTNEFNIYRFASPLERKQILTFTFHWRSIMANFRFDTAKAVVVTSRRRRSGPKHPNTGSRSRYFR